MDPKLTTSVTTIVAVLLLAAGIVLIFLPAETAALMTGTGEIPTIVMSLLGAALFGLGEMNWMARRAPIGGIYGRAVLVANLGHFLVGALALLKYSGAEGWGYWLMTGIYVAGMVFYGILFFTSPKPSRAPATGA